MSKSTLIKFGVLAVAALAAKSTYSALCRNASKTGSRDTSRVPDSTSAGKPADAFSTHSVQHDLSVGDAV